MLQLTNVNKRLNYLLYYTQWFISWCFLQVKIRNTIQNEHFTSVGLWLRDAWVVRKSSRVPRFITNSLHIFPFHSACLAAQPARFKKTRAACVHVVIVFSVPVKTLGKKHNLLGRYNDSEQSACDTFYESHSLLMSATRKSASALLSLLSPRQLCSGVWGSSVTSSVRTPMRTINVPSTPKQWRRPRGRPRQTWLRTVENDVKQQNLRLWSARSGAYDRE